MPPSIDRPERTYDTGPIAAALRWASWLPILAEGIVLAIRWPRLPEIVPTHFGLDGVPNDYGSKWVVLVLFVVFVGMQVGLHALSRHPRLFNYPTRVTEANAQALYRAGERTFIGLLAAIGLVILGLVLEVLQVPGGAWLGGTAIAALVILIVAGIVWMVRAGRTSG